MDEPEQPAGEEVGPTGTGTGAAGAGTGAGPGTPLETGSEGYFESSDGYGFPEGTTPTDEPRGGWLPDEALGAVATGTEGLERRREWQVNIRLGHERYATLKRAADIYGTRPTTMARILVNRGAEAVVNAHRAEMAAIDWPDQEG